MGLGPNISALLAIRRLNSASSLEGRAIERLGSGVRINRASDDAAGLSVSARLNADSRIYGQAIRNLNDGVSYLNIAQDTVSQLSGITDRLRELASQASNGTYSAKQRSALDGEASKLVSEYNRLIASTQFNGSSIFANGRMTIHLQGGTGTQGMVTAQIGAGLATSTTAGGSGDSYDFDFQSGDLFGSGESVLADFDGDGILDVVTVSPASSYFTVNSGHADGTFTNIGKYTLGGLGMLRVGDFNGDGAKDLFLQSDKNISIWENDGSGNFTSSNVFQPVDKNLVDFQVADVNKDGMDDIVVSGNDGQDLNVWRSAGNGNFNIAFSDIGKSVGTYGKLALADMDGDHYADIVIGAVSGASMQVMQNQGAGVFFSSVASFKTQDASITALTIEDWDSDGRMDIMYGTKNGVISLIHQSVSGTFQDNLPLIATGLPSVLSLHAVDYDRDGALDVVAGGVQTNMFKGSGGTSFTLDKTYATSGSSGLAMGDLNNDGLMDFIGFGSSNYVGLESDTPGSPGTTTTTNYIDPISLATVGGARAALTTLNSLALRINQELSYLGASQSRLEVSLRNLGTARLETEAARSRIVDADIATETSTLVRAGILKQLGAAVLAQANQQPALVLQLLRN